MFSMGTRERFGSPGEEFVFGTVVGVHIDWTGCISACVFCCCSACMVVVVLSCRYRCFPPAIGVVVGSMKANANMQQEQLVA